MCDESLLNLLLRKGCSPTVIMTETLEKRSGGKFVAGMRGTLLRMFEAEGKIELFIDMAPHMLYNAGFPTFDASEHSRVLRIQNADVAEDIAIKGFEHSGICVVNPFMDETGRHCVDPETYYGDVYFDSFNPAMNLF